MVIVELDFPIRVELGREVVHRGQIVGPFGGPEASVDRMDFGDDVTLALDIGDRDHMGIVVHRPVRREIRAERAAILREQQAHIAAGGDTRKRFVTIIGEIGGSRVIDVEGNRVVVRPIAGLAPREEGADESRQ